MEGDSELSGWGNQHVQKSSGSNGKARHRSTQSAMIGTGLANASLASPFKILSGLEEEADVTSDDSGKPRSKDSSKVH